MCGVFCFCFDQIGTEFKNFSTNAKTPTNQQNANENTWINKILNNSNHCTYVFMHVHDKCGHPNQITIRCDNRLRAL